MPYDPEDAEQAIGDITITYIYEGWDTTIIDPDGKYKRVTGDNLSRTVSVYEFIDALEKETDYMYNATGDLRRIHLFDPERSRTWFIKFFYDSLGRKTETHDPNMGTWFYEYDDNGNMTELEDAKGNIITFQYDALNRPQKKTSMTADATVEDEVINIYDKSPNGKGRLYISKNNKDGDNNYGVEIMIDDYDEMGNVLSETKTIRDPDFEESYTTQMTYDKSGKPIEMIYPASPGQTALKVETTYHAGTSLVAMVSSDEATPTTYANFSDYDASGKIKTAMYGYEPGDGDYATRTDYHYRPATGRLGEIRTIQGNLINDPDNPETILQNKVYNYTKAGDVSRISTIVNRNMQVYEYEYDDLHRLTAERRIGSVPSNVIERYDNEFEGPQAHAVSSTVHQLTYGTMPYEVVIWRPN